MRTHLILDEQSAPRHEGVTFALNPAVKHPENPVMLPGEPHQWDSLQISWPATVLYSPEEKKFRCWYSGLDVIQSPDRFWKPGYAESEDGIHWVKPDLGQVEFLGADTNRIEVDWGYSLLSCVFENPDPAAAESKRFASLWTEIGDGMSYLRKRLAYSPDGIHWTRERTVYEGIPFDRASFQDISQIVYDAEEPDPQFRIRAYSQLIRKRAYDGRDGVRHIGLAHGTAIDQLAGAADPVSLAPEQGIDEELHFASVRKSDGQCPIPPGISPIPPGISPIPPGILPGGPPIGAKSIPPGTLPGGPPKSSAQFLMLFESDNFSRNPIHGDLKLAVSEDGRKFRRVHPRAPLVATGPKGFWDENLLVTTTSAMQEVGDEVYIYYIGCPNIYNSWPPPYMVSPERRGSMFAPAYLGLATLPRDRYAYAEGPGSVTVQAHFGDIYINADGDDIAVSALDRSRTPLALGRLTGETVEGVYRKVAWDRPLASAVAALRVSLGYGCRLYSVGMICQPSTNN